MTIHDLAAQYRADGKARVFVEAVWKIAGPTEEYPPSRLYFGGNSVDDCWDNTADWTLERIEEIRQAQEEIEWLINRSEIPSKQKELYKQRGMQFSDEFLNDIKIAQRILAARRAHLDSLCEGMRKEVLNG